MIGCDKKGRKDSHFAKCLSASSITPLSEHLTWWSVGHSLITLHTHVLMYDYEAGGEKFGSQFAILEPLIATRTGQPGVRRATISKFAARRLRALTAGWKRNEILHTLRGAGPRPWFCGGNNGCPNLIPRFHGFDGFWQAVKVIKIASGTSTKKKKKEDPKQERPQTEKNKKLAQVLSSALPIQQW